MDLFDESVFDSLFCDLDSDFSIDSDSGDRFLDYDSDNISIPSSISTDSSDSFMYSSKKKIVATNRKLRKPCLEKKNFAVKRPRLNGKFVSEETLFVPAEEYEISNCPWL